MVADWYCVIDNRQFGPITAVQLKQLATTGKLQPSHLVWKEGMQNRVPAQSVKGLFDPGPAGEAGRRSGPGRNEGPIEVEPIEVIPEPEEVEPEEVNDVEAEEVQETVEAESVSGANEKKAAKPKGGPGAKTDYKQIQKTQKKSAREQAAPNNGVAPSTPAAAAAAPGGKPYRILTGGKVQGSFSLQEIRQLLRSGKLKAGDLIGVETWLPVATLSGLLGEQAVPTTAGGPSSKRIGGTGAGAVAVEGVDEPVDEDDLDEEAEMAEEEESEDDEAEVAEEDDTSKEDSDSVSVDKEFQLD